MIKTPEFYEFLIENKLDTFYGVPDSLLKDICAYITSKASSEKHIITANEGNAVGLAAGKFMATGLPAVVYLQNSGLGNTINPLISLADESVYKIPMLLMIGWRGEPNVHDEPQHIKQGKTTLSMLDTMGIKYLILTENYQEEILRAINYMRDESKAFAIIIKKNTFSKFTLNDIKNPFSMTRESALEILMKKIDKNSLLVSTTGKTSREVFELREKNSDTHERDFLTVGSMGHSASIALGLSLSTKRNVYCIDGDGSLLMHLGGLGISAKNAKDNFKYIVINNGSHESVGGQPTIGFDINLKKILTGLGFSNVFEVSTASELNDKFKEFNVLLKAALVINVKQGSRDNLGRPTYTPQQNKIAFMNFIKEKGKL